MDLLKLSPIEFESLCKELMEQNGFRVKTTKTTGDGGIDLIATKTDAFTSGIYIVQCKRYSGSVGEPVLRDLYGVVMSERANKGILITTGTFTNGARNFSSGKPLELIDGNMLEQLIDSTDFESSVIQDDEVEFIPLFDHPISISGVNKHEVYDMVSEMYEKDQTNINYFCQLITLFSDAQLSQIDMIENSYNDAATEPVILYLKKMASQKLISLCSGMKNTKYFNYEILLYMAQSYFLMGDMVAAINYYNKLLLSDKFIMYPANKDIELYSGENELAYQVVKNIVGIFTMFGLTTKAELYKQRYNYIYKQEERREQRIQDIKEQNKEIQNDFLKDTFDWINDMQADLNSMLAERDASTVLDNNHINNKVLQTFYVFKDNFFDSDTLLYAAYLDAMAANDEIRGCLQELYLVEEITDVDDTLLFVFSDDADMYSEYSSCCAKLIYSSEEYNETRKRLMVI